MQSQSLKGDLYQAILDCNLVAVTNAIDKGANPNDHIEPYTKTDLLVRLGLAVVTGVASSAARMFFGNSRDSVRENRTYIKGDTFLHLAVRLLELDDRDRDIGIEIVRLLVSRGANVDALNDMNEKPAHLIPDSCPMAVTLREGVLKPKEAMIVSAAKSTRGMIRGSG